MSEQKGNYGADNIQALEGLEAVRKRPGMYIGSTDVKGLHHLVWEVIDNSIDEHLAGYCTHIEVIINKDSLVEDTVSLGQAVQVGGELEVRLGEVGGVGLPGVVTAGAQLVDAALLDVEADDLVGIGEGHGQGKPDIAEADNCDGFIHGAGEPGKGLGRRGAIRSRGAPDTRRLG